MLIVSLLYWAFVIVALPTLFVPGFLVWLFALPFDRRRVAFRLYSCWWGAFMIWANPLWRVDVTGRDRIPWRQSAVIVSNHLSLIDILVLCLLYRPYKWVSKVENFKLPIIGWIMRMNRDVPLVRGNRESVAAMFEMCRRYLENRSSVVIFPEGTRSETGQLQPFKDGAFQLAKETGRPIIPVVITGTYDTLPKRSLVLRNRMDATVRVLEPIDAAGYDSVEELRDATFAVMYAALNPERPLSEAV